MDTQKTTMRLIIRVVNQHLQNYHAVSMKKNSTEEYTELLMLPQLGIHMN